MFVALCFTLLTACIIDAIPQETATPANFLQPRNFNYHPYQARQYLEETKPTKQGPVLFPNDAPPPPRPPLVVTSRPLVESIARSELNQNPVPSQASPKPALHTSVSYEDQKYVQGSDANSANRVPAASSYTQVPYADMLKKARLNGYRQSVYNDYEERIVVPVYRGLSSYANQNQNLLKNQKSTNNNYQTQNSDYGKQYENKVSDESDNVDYDQNQNYAFSYTVRDQETGDDFSHMQESISGGTNGEYRVRLPDGRIQIVSYTADESGYKADVRYDNENNVDNYNYQLNDNDKNQYNDQNLQNYYVNENFKEEVPIKEEPNQYNSKEYYDYSSDYNQNYEPYQSKYAIYKPVSTPTISTVRPYTVNNLVNFTPKPVLIYSDGILSASNPIVKYKTTTERVVSIGEKKLYTNNIPETSTQVAQNTFAASPASYLASTIASLRERIAPKGIVSGFESDRSYCLFQDYGSCGESCG